MFTTPIPTHSPTHTPLTKPKKQLIGTTFGGLCSIFAFWLYTAAYPCMLNPADETCPFAMSAAHAWRVLAEALSQGITVGDTGAETITTFGYYLLIAAPVITCLEQVRYYILFLF